MTQAETKPGEQGALVPALSTLANTSTVSYEQLMGGPAAVVEGYSLTDKDELLAYPFFITGVTFRYGGKDATGKVRDYVSVEAVTKDSAAIVFNDGSTGIRRQIVQYLSGYGVSEVMDLGDSDDPIVKTPEADAFEVKFDNGPVPPLRCPRGLRRSDYQNEFTNEGQTYYLG